MIGKEEKKVQYIELIYDLIFVYIIGRNNSLLHNLSGGFVEKEMLLAYVLCTLATIQIWSFTTFYINMFGTNGRRDHIFMFINMYLLYFMAEGTRRLWQSYGILNYAAWALILINIGMQYIIELKNHRADVWNRDIIKKISIILFTEACIIIAAAVSGGNFGVALSAAAILFGIIFTTIGKNESADGMVDFAHLTERAMLYVVFTFGEMIIAIASYFEGGDLNFNTIYFSVMAFLIVVGLFLSYGTFYDHLLNRETENNGLVYMLIHVGIIFALNNITTALEFMREEEVEIIPKMLFLVISLVGYYALMFLLGRYAKNRCKPDMKFTLKIAILAAGFVTLMIVFKNMMIINIMLTVVFVFTAFLILSRFRCEKNFNEPKERGPKQND